MIVALHPTALAEVSGKTLVHEPVHKIKSTRANTAAERMNPAHRIVSCLRRAELKVYS